MKVIVDSIEMRFSTEGDFNVGGLIALINPQTKEVRSICCANTEVKFSKGQMEELKRQVQQKILDGKFLEAIEIPEE